MLAFGAVWIAIAGHDPDAMLPAAVGAAGLIGIVASEFAKAGPESKRKVDRIALVIGETIQTNLDNPKDYFDVRAAANALDDCLSDCFLKRDALVEAASDPAGFPVKATAIIMEMLATKRPNYFGPGAPATGIKYASEVVSAALLAAIDDREYFEKLEARLAFSQSRDIARILEQNHRIEPKIDAISDNVAALHPKFDEVLSIVRAQAITPAQRTENRRPRKSSIRYEDVSFVSNKGWSDAEFIKKIYELDSELTENLTEENEAPLGEQIRTFFDFPDTWRLIVDHSDTIIGYWRLSPLTSEVYEKARSGKLLDRELVVEAMPYFGPPDIYDVYVAFIGVDKKKAGVSGFWQLVLSMFAVLDKLAKADIFIGRVCANGLSPDGKKLCEKYMEYVCKHEFAGHIYEADMQDLMNKVLLKDSQLAKKYKSVWRTYCSRFSC